MGHDLLVEIVRHVSKHPDGVCLYREEYQSDIFPLSNKAVVQAHIESAINQGLIIGDTHATDGVVHFRITPMGEKFLAQFS